MNKAHQFVFAVIVGLGWGAAVPSYAEEACYRFCDVGVSSGDDTTCWRWCGDARSVSVTSPCVAPDAIPAAKQVNYTGVNEAYNEIKDGGEMAPSLMLSQRPVVNNRTAFDIED